VIVFPAIAALVLVVVLFFLSTIFYQNQWYDTTFQKSLSYYFIFTEMVPLSRNWKSRWPASTYNMVVAYVWCQQKQKQLIDVWKLVGMDN